jgi:hypothetical protein
MPSLDELLQAGAQPLDEPNQSVSEEAILRAIAAQEMREVPQVGAGETYLNTAVDAIPLGGRLRDILQAIGDRDIGVRARLTPQAREELLRMGEEVPPTAEEPRSILDTYRTVRDERRERTAAGSQQNPNAARAGTATGIGLSILAPLPGVKVGTKAATTGAVRGATGLGRLRALVQSPMASRLASATATGGAYGALSGATDGEADLTRGDIRGVLEDTVRGAGHGAAWGAAGGVVAEGARQGIPWLRRLAVRNTKEAIQAQSNIGAATRKPMREESAELMLDDDNLRAFDNAEDIYNRIVPRADEEGAELGRIIKDLEARGFTGPHANKVAQQLMREYHALKPNISSDKSPAEVFVQEATNINTAARPFAQHLGLKQAENIKSSIQGRAPFAKLESTERGDSLKKASRVLRLATEDSLLEQAAARDAKANAALRYFNATPAEMGSGRPYTDKVNNFLNQKDRVGKYLDAAQFSTRARSKFDQRPRVGLSDTVVGAAAGGDNIIKQKIFARLNSELQSRSASTTAVGAKALGRSLQSGRAAERLGVGAVEMGPLVTAEVQDWANSADPRDPSLTPLQRAMIEVLRRPTPKEK